MIDFFPPDQKSIAVVQIFQEICGDSDDGFLRIYCFQETDALQQTGSLAMIDPFLGHLIADLDPDINDFLPDEKRNKPFNGKEPLWREVEGQEARAICINLLVSDLHEILIRENLSEDIVHLVDTKRFAPREDISEDIVRLAEAFLNLFAPDGQVLVNFSKAFLSTRMAESGKETLSIGDAVNPLTWADRNKCIIAVSRKNQRMGIVLANDWSG